MNASHRNIRGAVRLHLEPLEERRLLATCHVTRLTDMGVGKGFRGDLRYCINKVNDEPGPDVIDFSVTGTINLTGVLPDLASDVDIQGPGASLLVVRRDTTGNYRIFTVAGGTVSIRGLTVTNGSETVGGGIYNQGTLLLDDVAVAFNSGKEQGGGVYNAGQLEVYNSRIDDNRLDSQVTPPAHYFGGGGVFNLGNLTVEHSQINGNYAYSYGRIAGGGFHNAQGGTATIRFSTISNNDGESSSGNSLSYSYGGGIYTSGTLTVDSSAVIRNSAIDSPNGGGWALALGGGIYSACTATSTQILNSTITENDATSSEHADFSGGGGIYADCPNVVVKHSTITTNLAKASEYAYGGGIYGDLYMYNSIVAHNTVTDFPMYGPDYSGTLKGSGFNIFRSGNGVNGFAESDMLDVEPMLGSLDDNGGTTLTVALLPGSPAIDAGINTFDIPDFDQRGPGFPRVVNGAVDIGAFEVQSTNLPPGARYFHSSILITADWD